MNTAGTFVPLCKFTAPPLSASEQMLDSHSDDQSFPADVERLAAMHRAFNAALSAFQGEMQAAKRDGKNPHFRNTYATLSSVIEAVKPACKHGLSHTQTLERSPDGLILVTTLRHKDGFEVRSELPLVLGNDWQRFGSAYTYARRYALMGIYGIASSDDDDDGTAASGPAPKRPPAPAKAAEPSPLELRTQAVTQALTALHEADPDAIKPLVEEYRAAFKVPAKTPVARSFDTPERLAWFEGRLGLPAAEPDAPTP